MATAMTAGYVLAPGAGLYAARGGQMTIKARGEQTAGAFVFLELVHPAESPGPPLHVHHAAEETFFVLEGILTVRLGEQTIEAPAGSFVLVPRGVVHTFANRGTRPVRLLATMSPAATFGYIEEINALYAALPPGDRIDMAAATEIGRRYGTEFLGPPLAVSCGEKEPA